MKAKRHKLGLYSMILLGINSILGTGIFLLPGKAMALVGPASMFVYLFVTIAAIAIAFCFAECASLFSRNGAAYVYAKEAFGDFVGFEVGIMKWVVSVIAWATLAVGFVTALAQIFPAAAQEPYRSLLLVILIGGLGIMNIMGVKMVQFLNNLVTVGKVVPLVFFIIFGILFMEKQNFTPMFTQEFELSAFGSASLLIFFAFSGFEALAVAAEDMENPRRNIPLAIFAILLIISGIYFSIQAVVIGILGPALANTPAPIAQAAEIMIGPAGKWSVMACMLVASCGTNIAASFLAPRSAIALAQDGMVPTFIAKLGRNGTPVIAIVITTVAAILIAMSGSFVKLAVISVIARFAQYLPTCVAVIVLRKKRPDLTSSFPRILGPVIPLFAITLIVWLMSNASSDELIFGLGGLLVGVPLYFIQKYSYRFKVVTGT